MSVLLSYMVWPGLVALPLVLTYNDTYKAIFPPEWYDEQNRDFWFENRDTWPSPLGLSLGIMAVVVGQFFMLLYFVWVMREQGIQNNAASAVGTAKKNDDKEVTASASTTPKLFPAIQREGARPYDLYEGLVTHLGQPEGFVMLGGYLAGTWMFGLMPASYYSFSGGINWFQVAQQLLLQDLIQYLMHLLEHEIKTTSFLPLPSLALSWGGASSSSNNSGNEKGRGGQSSGITIKWPFNLYFVSHKPHHRFTNPRLFDAFNGSPTDTFLMILVPLVLTARLVNANVWTYMAFGSMYANWLTMIHAEYSHPWDGLFRKLGFGTSADHHVHHKLFNYNYGHTFMYWDRMFGTYRDPATVTEFNPHL